jgi:hypothetical protein
MKNPVGRLAMRHEGENWSAYYARPDTMEDAILLGTIRMVIVLHNPARKQAFMALMQDAASDLIENAIGEKPEWPDGPKPAPEHERSGHG